MESTCRRWPVAVTCVALVLLRYGGAARPDDITARDLLKSVYDSAPRVPFTAEVTLTAPGGERRLLLSHKRVGDRHATFMEVSEPDNLRDTRFLLFEQLEGADELYIYLPALRRIIPVRDTYGGCLSWLQLEDEFSLEGLQPVLDDGAYERLLQPIRAIRS